MRLNQFLAHAGLGSRRSVEALVSSGRVTINGVQATLQARIDPASDTVQLDGRKVRLPDRYQYLLLHKPVGFTVTRSDPHAKRCVYDLLPGGLRHLAYVGRLDRESEGLLLFSDDGELCHRLLLPSYRVEREYRVTVEGDWQDDLAARLVKGVAFPEGPPLSATRVEAIRVYTGGAELCIVLREGKKREVRRLCAEFRLKVARLRRVRFGPVHLGELPPGRHRELTQDEIDSLRQLVRLPRN